MSKNQGTDMVEVTETESYSIPANSVVVNIGDMRFMRIGQEGYPEDTDFQGAKRFKDLNEVAEYFKVLGSMAPPSFRLMKLIDISLIFTDLTELYYERQRIDLNAKYGKISK